MNDNQLVGKVIAVGIGITAMLIAAILISSSIDKAARKKEIAAITVKLDDAISSSNQLVQDRRFDQAKTTLQAMASSIEAIGNNSLQAQFNQTWVGIADAKREYDKKLRNGWTTFEGTFVSPEEKDRILDERDRQREKELRVLQAREDQRMAERQRREEQRKQQEKIREERQRQKEEQERKARQPTSITWSEYVSHCGVLAQRANQARTEQWFKREYKGKRIRWSGRVVNVTSAFLSDDYLVLVRMDPTDESLAFDVSLDVAESFFSIVMSLNKGDPIEFVGTITRQGGSLTGHNIQIEQITKH